jgi:hypothetical protein
MDGGTKILPNTRTAKKQSVPFVICVLCFLQRNSFSRNGEHNTQLAWYVFKIRERKPAIGATRGSA